MKPLVIPVQPRAALVRAALAVTVALGTRTAAAQTAPPPPPGPPPPVSQAPAPALVIGGALYLDGTVGQPTSTDVKIEGQRAGSLVFDRASLALLGPFIDYYIDPKLGFHVEGSLGIAGMTFGRSAQLGKPATTE